MCWGLRRHFEPAATGCCLSLVLLMTTGGCRICSPYLPVQSVIERERRGDYLGKTVQVVPHITDAIQVWLAAWLPAVPAAWAHLLCCMQAGSCSAV